jgi:hypothetical protein
MPVLDDGDYDPLRRWRDRLKEIKQEGRARERAVQKERAIAARAAGSPR